MCDKAIILETIKASRRELAAAKELLEQTDRRAAVAVRPVVQQKGETT